MFNSIYLFFIVFLERKGFPEQSMRKDIRFCEQITKQAEVRVGFVYSFRPTTVYFAYKCKCLLYIPIEYFSYVYGSQRPFAVIHLLVASHKATILSK